MNNKTKILIASITATVLMILTLLHGFWIAPSQFQIRKETLKAKEIPASLDQMKLLYFSDIQYGEFLKEKRLEQFCDQVNRLSPDTILFGGDLFSTIASLKPEEVQVVQKLFQKMKAPYGKFAVLGDQDTVDETHRNTVLALLQTSQFEVLENRHVSLHKGQSESIQLVGLSDGIHQAQDIKTAYENIVNNQFVLTLMHTPDTANSLPADLTNYALAGHSLGGQVYLWLHSMVNPAMAKDYFRSKSLVQGKFIVDITNGVGTIHQDVRLFAPAEMVLYTLKKANE